MGVETFSFPASFAQRRLWFVAQLEPTSPFYHVPVTLGLSGSLDVPALQRSLATIVARHETLRTTLLLVGSEPVQVVRESGFELPVIEVRGDSPDERDRERQRLSREEVLRPFDLERGPLFRARLYRLASDEHVFLLVFHHAVFDGWSAGVLFRELSECYRAYVSGETPRLPELPIQYGDFAAWEREWLSGEVLDRQLGYWRERLAGAPGLLELPTDYRRPPTQTYRGATRKLMVPRALLAQLKALSQQEGATLFMTLLAAFQVLLARYTGERDIVVGTPIANRTRDELEGLIGFFVNSLVLRTDLSDDPTFRELLGQVRETALGAYAHQEVPFDKLVEELHIERVRDRNPLFQVVFALQNAPQSSLQFPGVRVHKLSSRMGIAKFDLTLSAAESTDGLRTSVEYSSDLFEPTTIDRLLEHYRMLLESVVSSPDRRVSTLPFMTAEERREVVVAWNRTERSYDGHRCIHQWFEDRVTQRPGAVAVESSQGQLTYRELDRRANRLARALRRMGVSQEARVGVALERSSDLVVSLLAVLKAGGAYVPLDPSYPAERVAFMLDDAKVSVLITTADVRLPGLSHLAVLRLDADREVIERESDRALESATSPEQLAYVMYTSGSTGRPKGIGIPHRAVLRLVRNTDYVQLTADDVVAQVSNVSFDAATFEIWGALLAGGRLVIIPWDVALSPRALADELRRTGVTAMFLTVALFNQLAEGIPGAFATLRHLLFGGEAADPRWVREVLNHEPPERLLNGYGPTETTTFAICHEVHEVGETAATVPIGRPIANTQAYVLDRHLEPQPVGVPGELYLGGPGLARGYWNRPALTAERFIPHPFSTSPGARLYRTGDRVRWRPNGTLEFLGRLDGQVKIRGFRIEPGEVETVLASHPAIGECAVIARDDLPGGRALVAYVVPRSPSNGGPPDHGWLPELHRYLRDRVPPYMVPSAIVLLESLPLTPNGKVARRSLPPPRDLAPGAAGGATTPRTPIEKALAKVWCEVLGVERASLEDDFFESGGHSILAVRLFAEIERAFERRLPLSTLFQAPTLGELAEVLARIRPRHSETGLVALMPRGSRPPLFVAHNVDGDLLEYRELLNRLGTDQPAYGLEPPVSGDGKPVLSTLEDLAARYVNQIREAQPSGPYYICGYCWAGPLAFEMARQLLLSGQEIGLLALIDSRCPGTRRVQRLDKRVRRRGGWAWRLISDNFQRLRQTQLRSIPQFAAQRVVNIATRIGGVAAYRWSVRLGRPLLPVFRDLKGALLYAGRSYRPRPYPGRITVLYAQPPGDPARTDRSLGWNTVAGLGTESYEISGEHFGVMLPPDVDQLAARLRECLHRAQADTG